MGQKINLDPGLGHGKYLKVPHSADTGSTHGPECPGIDADLGPCPDFPPLPICILGFEVKIYDLW